MTEESPQRFTAQVTVTVYPGATYEEAITAFRRELLFAALDWAEGNMAQAARAIGRSRSGVMREVWERHGVKDYKPKPYRWKRQAKVRP